MSAKTTCGVMYLEAIQKYGNGDPALERAFAAGFVSGQAEKVYLGACKAAMFRPSEERRPLIVEILADVLPRYDLIVNWIESEAWISKPKHGPDVLKMTKFEVNSAYWHVTRGQLCGVPTKALDTRFHQRRGYGERCD